MVLLVPGPAAAQWALQSQDSTTEYRGLAAVSAQAAWAAGRGGAWARTTDGGAEWVRGQVPGAEGLFLIDVHAPSPVEAVVLGTSFDGGLARVYRTSDGGETWQQVWEDARPGAFYDGLAFVDARRGVAFGDPLGGRLAVARTTDGGRTWVIPDSAHLPRMAEGEAGFAASGTAIAASGGTVWVGTGGAAQARVLRSTDAGATWTAATTPLPAGPSAGIFGLAFRDGRRGVAVGGDYQAPERSEANLLLTRDGGASWRLVTGTGLEGVQYGVVHVEAGTYVATNPRGSFISHDDGATWRRVDHGPWNTAGFAGGLAAGWAAGPGGRIGRWVGPAAAAPAPALVVLVAIDQLRNDYLDRWSGQWRGGFRRLLREGTLYVEGRQDHALTATAPGQASMLSGRWPARTGIVSNNFGVNGPEWPLVAGTGPGASPTGFRGSALLDWMLARDPATRSLGVSAKDRSAILPLGRAGGEVYWWGQGVFTTSLWYADSLPDWVQRFNARPWQAGLAAREWTLLRPESSYPEVDNQPWETGGRDVTFPHVLPADSATLARRIIHYPWMDSLTIAFALEGVQRLGLGQRAGRTDLLNLSLSTTDRVGHAYGPDSRELHDHLLRLDRWLGGMLDSLAMLVPGQLLVALTSDHGVQALPEAVRAAGGQAGRLTLRDLAAEGNLALEARWGTRFGLAFDNGLLHGNVNALRARGVAVDSLAEALAVAARTRPGVARVFTPRSLAAAAPDDSLAVLWRRQLSPDFEWLLAAVPEPGWTWSTGTDAGHGSALLDDRRVPILFWGAGVPAARCGGTVPVVDVGATLAARLGVIPTEPLDGQPLPLSRCRP